MVFRKSLFIHKLGVFKLKAAMKFWDMMFQDGLQIENEGF